MTDTVEPITLDEREDALNGWGRKEEPIECGRYIWAGQRYESALRASEERIKKLEKSLAPFSDFAEIFSDQSWSDADKLEIYIEGTAALLWTIPVSAFRRARQALGE